MSASEARFIDGPVPTNFEVLGRPGPDWPTKAYATMPLAALLEAAMWWVCWVLHDAIDGLVLFSLIAIVVAGIVATLPVRWLVHATGFRNLRKSIPIATTAVGIVLGEVALALHFLVSDTPALSVTDAVPLLGEWFAFQSTDYLALQLLAVVVMLGFASTLATDGRSSVSLWNGTIPAPRLRIR